MSQFKLVSFAKTLPFYRDENKIFSNLIRHTIVVAVQKHRLSKPHNN